MATATYTEEILMIPESSHPSLNTPIKQDEIHRSTTSLVPEPMVLDQSSGEPTYPSGLKFALVISSLCLALINEGFDNTIVATAVPALTDHFHTVADVGWYSAAYRLSLCAFQFLFGRLYKLFPAKRVLLATLAIMQLGFVLCATAPTSLVFVLGRAVAGLGAAGLLSGTFHLMARIVPLRRRPMYTALLSMVESMAEMASPILGGVLVEKAGWRWCFYLSLPLGGITIAFVALFLDEPPRDPQNLEQTAEHVGLSWWETIKQLDLLGNLLFLPSITSLFIALSWAGSKYAWSSPTVIGLFVSFAGLLVLFAWDQHHRGELAILPPRILRQRAVYFGFIYSACCAGSLQVFTFYLPTYFQTVHQYAPSKSGYMMLAPAVGFLIGMLGQGFGTSLIGYYVPFMLLGSLLGPIASGLTTTWHVDTSLTALILYSGFAGFALGIGYQGAQVAVQTTLSSLDAPIGLAVILFSQHFGSALFVSIAQTIFTNRLRSNFQALAPGVDTTQIENMGLSDLKGSLGPDVLKGVLAGFDRSLVQTWYLAVGLMCVTAVGSVGMEWRSVKTKKRD